VHKVQPALSGTERSEKHRHIRQQESVWSKSYRTVSAAISSDRPHGIERLRPQGEFKHIRFKIRTRRFCDCTGRILWAQFQGQAAIRTSSSPWKCRRCRASSAAQTAFEGPPAEPLPSRSTSTARIAFDLPNTTLPGSRRVDVHSGGVDSVVAGGSQWAYAPGRQCRFSAPHTTKVDATPSSYSRKPAGAFWRSLASRLARFGSRLAATRAPSAPSIFRRRLRRHRPGDRAAHRSSYTVNVRQEAIKSSSISPERSCPRISCVSMCIGCRTGTQAVSKSPCALITRRELPLHADRIDGCTGRGEIHNVIATHEILGHDRSGEIDDTLIASCGRSRVYEIGELHYHPAGCRRAAPKIDGADGCARSLRRLARTRARRLAKLRQRRPPAGFREVTMMVVPSTLVVVGSRESTLRPGAYPLASAATNRSLAAGVHVHAAVGQGQARIRQVECNPRRLSIVKAGVPRGPAQMAS